MRPVNNSVYVWVLLNFKQQFNSLDFDLVVSRRCTTWASLVESISVILFRLFCLLSNITFFTGFQRIVTIVALSFRCHDSGYDGVFVNSSRMRVVIRVTPWPLKQLVVFRNTNKSFFKMWDYRKSLKLPRPVFGMRVDEKKLLEMIWSLRNTHKRVYNSRKN